MLLLLQLFVAADKTRRTIFVTFAANTFSIVRPKEEGGARLLFKAMWQFIYCSTFVQRTNERFPPAADNLPTFGQAINIIINARLDLTHSLPSPSRCRTVHLSQKFDAQKEHYNNNNNKKNIIIVLSPVALSNRGNRPLSPPSIQVGLLSILLLHHLSLSLASLSVSVVTISTSSILLGIVATLHPSQRMNIVIISWGEFVAQHNDKSMRQQSKISVEYSKLWTELRKWNFSHGQRWHCPEPELGWGRGIGAYAADQT